MIMLILGGAAFMSAAMAHTQIPAAVAESVASLKVVALHVDRACLTLFYVILGMFLDGISMIVLTIASPSADPEGRI